MHQLVNNISQLVMHKACFIGLGAGLALSLDLFTLTYWLPFDHFLSPKDWRPSICNPWDRSCFCQGSMLAWILGVAGWTDEYIWGRRFIFWGFFSRWSLVASSDLATSSKMTSSSVEIETELIVLSLTAHIQEHTAGGLTWFCDKQKSLEEATFSSLTPFSILAKQM